MANIFAAEVSQSGTVYTLAGTDVLIVNSGVKVISTTDNTVVVTGVGNIISNNGAISSRTSDAIVLRGSGNSVNNTGIIMSGDDGVSMEGLHNSITNSGTIVGTDGLFFFTNSAVNAGRSTVLNTG